MNQRGLEHKMTEVKSKKMARQNKLWNHPHLFSIMGREIDVRWNPIYDGILVIYQTSELASQESNQNDKIK